MTIAFTPSHRGGSGPPLVLVHGITDTWRSWELVLPTLELHHDVLAVTLAGHAGGPALPAEGRMDDVLLDGIEAAMDEAGFERAHVAGNSLGGWLALRLAERGRALSVVALAPGGGWAPGDTSYLDTLAYFEQAREGIIRAAPHADALMATETGRRRATADLTVAWEHIPADLLAHVLAGAAGCSGLDRLHAAAREIGWPLDAARIDVPVRIVWGAEDRILPWPRAALRYRDDLLAQADWVVLDDVGHMPQLDVPEVTGALILEVG